MMDKVLVKARKVGSNDFEVSFSMDKDTMENRLIIINDQIVAFEKNIDNMNKQISILKEEKNQIEVALGTPVQEVKNARSK